MPATTEVFKVTPGANFTGDFVLQLYLTNIDGLVGDYRVLGLNWTVLNHAGNTNITAVSCTPSTGFLSLTNPTVDLEISVTGTPDGTEFIDVNITSGFFRTHYYGGGWGGSEDPQILCKVIQKGT